MRHLLIVAAVCVVAAPALASPEIQPVKGMNYASYDLVTGQLRPTAGPERIGDSVWASTQRTGYYSSSTDGATAEWWLDWGDIAGPQIIGGFAISYATTVEMPTLVDAIVLFFAEENGWNNDGDPREYLMGFEITDLPTADPGGSWNGWTVTFDLEISGSVFTIEGSDIDGDSLVDFGYTYYFNPVAAGDDVGPTLAGDPNVIPPTAPGIEDDFDIFSRNPAENPNTYVGTYYFGGEIYAQLYMELFSGEEPNIPQDCPEPGNSGNYCTADIDGDDCIVGISDLAKLLANYRGTGTHDDGDLDEDGDIDVSDLGALLGQYRDDCN